MKRIALIGLLTALLTLGLGTLYAASTTPSIEITGGPAPANYCNGGQLLVIPVQRNIAGQGSSLIQTYGDGEPYVLSENEGDYTGQYINAPDSIETFIPSGFGLSEDQDIIFEIYTYSEAWQNGKWTFFSRVSFKCATGEVNYIQIEDFGPAEPSIREVEVPVDGPAREIPGDIGPVSGQPEIMEINPQDNIIREMNEQEMRVPEAQISR
jgi:hypothetical protein